MTYEQLEHNMTNHAPRDEYVVSLFELLRGYAKELGNAIIDMVPESREQSLALTNLEQTLMWAIAGIARNQSTPTITRGANV